tara:strand:- start:387 stop:827 length:441 start_codon:yes stop_codon:yes gene_type:complete
MSDLTNYNSNLDNFDEDFMSILELQKKLLARQKKQEIKIDKVDDTANHALRFAQYAAKKAQNLEGQEGYYSVKKVDNLIGDVWKTNEKRSDISGLLRDLTRKHNRIRIKVQDSNWPKGVWGYDPYIIRMFLENEGIPVPNEIYYAQ